MNIDFKVPDITTLEKRFAFIDDRELKRNLAICLQYVAFLWKLEGRVSAELGGHVRFALYRDVLLHSAAVIEGSLHHALERYIKESGVPAASIMPKEEQYKSPIELHRFSNEEVLVAVTKIRKSLSLKHNTPFKEINKAAKKAGILSAKLFSESEKIREKRNNIHLAGKSAKKIYPTKKDINTIFANTTKILGATGKFLQGLAFS